MNQEELLADRFFEASRKASYLENEVENEILKILGIDPNDIDCHWPFSDFIFDYYDYSFELILCQDGLGLTEDQQQKCWALGFQRCWLCFGGDRDEPEYRELYYSR